jgi:hypothetical protein
MEQASGQSCAEGGTVTIDTQASDADLIVASLAEPDLRMRQQLGGSNPMNEENDDV